MAIDDRTSHLDLPLPHADNFLNEDVNRLRQALNSIDAKFEALDTLLSSDDTTLDTVQELVDAIKADQVTISSFLSHIGSGGTAHGNATTSVAGFMSSADKTKLDAVTYGPIFDEIEITPSTNGQTSFAVPGGYTAGNIMVHVGGLKYTSGDDFTATDGTNITLTVGLTTSDRLLVTRFKRGLVA